LVYLLRIECKKHESKKLKENGAWRLISPRRLSENSLAC
jgi:hypothetical protein